MSLTRQALTGLLWSSIDTIVLKGLSFVASIVLARLLGPSKFGLIGMIDIFIAIGASLVDSGLSSSIIRTKDADNKDFSTVFYMNLLISVVVYLIIFFAAPYIAGFYHQQILTNMIRVYCMSFVFSAFSAIQITLLLKKMHFKKLMYCNIPGTIIGVCVGIAMGYMNYGAWSIVGMYLSTSLIQTIVLWCFSDWKPALIFSKERLNFHFQFGYKLTLSGILNVSFNNIYNIIIGKLYSVKSLGYYERAYTFNDYPVTLLSSIITKVSYPLMANIQDQKERVSNAYKHLLQFTFFVTAPLMLGAAAISKPLFLLVLGQQWLPAVPFFQILCLSSIFYPIHSFNINVLKITGRSDLFLRIEIIKKLLIVVVIAVTISFGIYGLVWGSLVISISALIINTHYSSRLIQYTTMRQLLDMLPILLISITMAVLMWFIVRILLNSSLSLQIATSAIAGLLLYLTLNYLFKIPAFVFTFNLIKKSI